LSSELLVEVAVMPLRYRHSLISWPKGPPRSSPQFEQWTLRRPNVALTLVLLLFNSIAFRIVGWDHALGG
jgi:hypothetical protein